MDLLTKAYNLLQEKLITWFEDFVSMLPNYLAGLLILLLFIIVARYLAKVVHHILQRVSRNEAVNKFVSRVAASLFILLGFFIVLDIVKLDKTFASLLAGAGIIGLAFSLGFQDVVANFVSSFMIATRRPYQIGDIIRSNDIFGTVRKINMRSTHIDTPDGQRVVIPNRKIYQNPMRNYTLHGKRRIDLKVNVSYGDDMLKVEELVKQAVKKIDYLLPGTEVEFFYTEFGDYAIEFVVRYWIKYTRQVEYRRAVSDGMKHIKTTFNENDIVIPFPIRTLDFGIKGGKQLDEMLDENQVEKKASD